MKIDAVLLTCGRYDTLGEVVEGVKKQSCLRDIYVWHNGSSSGGVEGVCNIFSEKNFKCRIRHSLALSLDSDFVLFLDDDFIIPEDRSDHITFAIDRFGDNAVLGPEGVVIDAEEAKLTDTFYDWKNFIEYPEEPVEADIIKGRFHIVRKDLIELAFRLEGKINASVEAIETSDDIFLNMGIQMFMDVPSMVIPMPRFRELELGGLNERKNHFSLRGGLVKAFVDHGWETKRKRTVIASDGK